MPYQRWEYVTAGVDTLTDTQVGTHQPTVDFLNKYGEDGWELVGVTARADHRFALFYFKRPTYKVQV
jgi:hypothetical protein